MPVGGEIRCTLSKFGQVAKSEHFLLNLTQVLGMLKCFLNELICLAVDGGYISPEQGHEFLTQVRTNAPLSGFEHKGLPKEPIEKNAVSNG